MATDAAGVGIRPVVPAFRWLLMVFAALGLGATLALSVTPTRTDEFFAWTIEPPITAALLGAGYAGALLLFLLVARETVWANARIGLPAGFTLSVLMLVATLLHTDRFHFDSGDTLAAVVAWIWLVVYIVVPLLMVVVVALELRTPGGDPPRACPLPFWLRAAFASWGAAGVAGGAVLFAVPDEVAPHWPWAISPLTGRAIAAWMFALGVASLHGALENDLRRIRAGMIPVAIIGGVGLVAVARFSDDVRWDVGGWLLVLALAVLMTTGGSGWVLGNRGEDAT